MTKGLEYCRGLKREKIETHLLPLFVKIFWNNF